MTSRRIRFSVVAVFLFASVLASAVAPGRELSAGAAAKAAAQTYVFEGCWTYWPAGPCRDVFRDSSGQYWLCRDCGTTGTPNSSKCSRISPQTLNTGYWCS